MTQQFSRNKQTKAQTAEKVDAARASLFLVKPTTASLAIPASEPRIATRSRSLGLVALAAAALAAPLLWLLHAVLVSRR